MPASAASPRRLPTPGKTTSCPYGHRAGCSVAGILFQYQVIRCWGCLPRRLPTVRPELATLTVLPAGGVRGGQRRGRVDRSDHHPGIVRRVLGGPVRDRGDGGILVVASLHQDADLLLGIILPPKKLEEARSSMISTLVVVPATGAGKGDGVTRWVATTQKMTTL